MPTFFLWQVGVVVRVEIVMQKSGAQMEICQLRRVDVDVFQGCWRKCNQVAKTLPTLVVQGGIGGNGGVGVVWR
ncbi:MAG: hypothetical protein IJF10_05800 [Clostridia bacterium]|nr:hypothetical protein [Clostridia bacterium]